MSLVRVHSRFLLFFVFLLLIPFFCTGAEPFNTYCDNNGGKVMTDNLQELIDQILKHIIAEASDGGHSHFSLDQGGDFMGGLAQCRRDLSNEECSACLRDADAQIRTLCPDKMDVRIWFDHCFVRYDTDDFFWKLDTTVAFEGPDDLEEVPEPDRFTVELDKLMKDVQAQAMLPGSNGLGKAATNFTPTLTLYALFQCTQDLSAQRCGACLNAARQTFADLCLHKKGCTVAFSSCYVRYAFQSF